MQDSTTSIEPTSKASFTGLQLPGLWASNTQLSAPPTTPPEQADQDPDSDPAAWRFRLVGGATVPFPLRARSRRPKLSLSSGLREGARRSTVSL
ncbi:Uu.00g134150.m01.CDS01 [Anthostomella pinea]|uniref:Uu.00g134150.m01.CDS01 n=1 Tax=Anthostomella pinea TaxID=933095 RepID=A0AAI8VNY8_9PEZI|nr:Uu.00g134150.m01.CDS01 [Anthostomella pinea]